MLQKFVLRLCTLLPFRRNQNERLSSVGLVLAQGDRVVSGRGHLAVAPRGESDAYVAVTRSLATSRIFARLASNEILSLHREDFFICEKEYYLLALTCISHARLDCWRTVRDCTCESILDPSHFAISLRS